MIPEYKLQISPSWWSHLPLQDLRPQAERSSTVVTLQLHAVVPGGERRLSVGGRLKSGVLEK